MTKMTVRSRSACIAAVFALACACGGAAPKSSESAPQSPAQYQQGYPSVQAGAGAAREDAKKEPTTVPQKSSADSASEPAPPPPPAAAPGAPAGAPPRASAARREVEAAQRELDMAGNSCAAACRALGSMERATARLCTLEETSCEDVRVRLRRARERVRSSCGTCSGGPSVDPDAPIPSK